MAYDYDENSEKLKSDPRYGKLRKFARLMDSLGVDPLIGFLLPIVGDALSLVLSLPFLYIALVRLKSLPLALVLLYNMLFDVVLGLIPFGIGDVLDVFHRSFINNYRLLINFMEGDARTVRRVSRQSLLFGVPVLLLLAAAFVFVRNIWLGLSGGWTWLAGLFSFS